jgi:hypothetical protein
MTAAHPHREDRASAKKSKRLHVVDAGDAGDAGDVEVGEFSRVLLW